MKEQNPALQDESIKTDNETCERCATEKAEPESNTAQEETGCCCHCKTTARSQDERKKLMNRLSRIEGQIRGIKGMVEKDCYCPDIITQVAAANAALNSFNKVLLAQHIRTCVADGIRNGEDDKVDELVTMLQKLMK